MDHLSDQLLLESFYKAKELHLGADFLTLIMEEIIKRNLQKELQKQNQISHK